jgi:hypothetical protein
MKVFIPRDLVLDPQKLARAVDNALDAAAEGALVDFKVTTQTWSRKVAFMVVKQHGRRVVGTDDEIYGYVTEGTRPHVIVARGKALAFPGAGFRPKSRVRVIGSNKGNKGSGMVFTKQVNHPGTEAREFEEVIAEKWRTELPRTMQRAIDAEQR